jgi:hypothetical protein
MSDTYSNFQPDIVQQPPPGPQPGSQPPAVQQPPAQPVAYQPPGPGAPQFPMVAPLANLVRGFFPQPRPQQEQFTRLDEPRDQPPPASTITSWSQPAPGEWRPPYIPVRPRSAREAGGEWWPITGANNYPGADAGPMLPSPREAIGVMGHAGRYLQQWGSPSVSPFMGRASQMAMQLAPILDMLSKGAFSKNFMQARMGQFKLMQDEMLMNAQMGLQQHQKELMDYSDVFRAFDAGALGATPQANAQEAHRQLEELAQSHPNLLAILKNKGVGAMERAVQAEDAQYRNMYAGFTSAKKARDDAGESAFEDGGAAGGGVSGMGQREDPLALKPDIKAPGPVAEDTSAVPATADEHDKLMDDIAKKHTDPTTGRPLSKESMGTALDVVNGTKGAKDIKALGHYGAGAVAGAAAEINNGMEKILNDPSLEQDEKLKRLEALNPARAAQLKGLLDYDNSPKDITIRSGPGNRSELENQARRINPKYSAANFDVVEKFKKDNLPKFAATATMAQSMIQVYKALKEFKEGETYPRAVLNQLIDNKYLRDDKYARLYQAVNDYAINTAMVQGGGSQARVTLVKNLLQHMDATASPWQIRSQMDVDTNGAYARVQALNDQWRSMTGRTDNAPGFLKSADDIIRSFREHVNKKTGQVDIDAKDVPDEVKGLNKIPSAQDRPYGRTKADERPPIPQDRIDQMKQRIEEYNRNPNPADRDKIQRYRSILSDQGVL